MDWIVLSYEVGEYLILYKIPVGNNLKDSSIWGADVYRIVYKITTDDLKSNNELI